MELQPIIDKIQDDVCLEPDVEIAADTELLMSGVVDSLGVVSLIAWLEDELGMTVDPGLVTLENFERPTAIHQLCTRLASAK